MDTSASHSPPRVVVLAGPNGAGKSTCAARLLRGVLGVDEFVNADIIAQGLSGFAPQRVAMAAGRIMMQRLRQLAASRVSFGFETTLASRSFAPWLDELQRGGYLVQLVFLWLPSADMAVARVAERVRRGGHDVPEETIRRRYERGLQNFVKLYQSLADEWQVLDNSKRGKRRLIATGRRMSPDVIRDVAAWNAISSLESEDGDSS
jgi:predicted ABC-type ATPase